MLHEHYDWNNLIDIESRQRMCLDIDNVIDQGHWWKNNPPYQTNINIFGLQGSHWINMKMAFIWSVFAYLDREVQIKGVKSWGYKGNVDTQPASRDMHWHQHIREQNTVVSGVYYLHLPEGVDTSTAGTELAPEGPERPGHYFAEGKVGHWMIFPGKTWHRPGIIDTTEYRYVIAADLEF